VGYARSVKRALAAGVAALAASALLAQVAAASSGSITRAFSNSTWTRGSIAGSIDWTDCGGGFCSWLPIATVQPSLPEYRCLGDEALDSDPNTQVVWSGGARNFNGTASFDLVDAPILNGVHGQRLCLSAIQTTQIRDPVCVAQAPILGLDPNACPLVNRIAGRVLATTLLTVEPVPSTTTLTPVVTQPVVSQPITTVPPVEENPVRPAQRTKAALARRFARRWLLGNAKRLRCQKLGKRWICRVTWRHGRWRYKGQVRVSETGKTTILVRRVA
jgi:hypothetical protein